MSPLPAKEPGIPVTPCKPVKPCKPVTPVEPVSPFAPCGPPLDTSTSSVLSVTLTSTSVSLRFISTSIGAMFTMISAPVMPCGITSISEVNAFADIPVCPWGSGLISVGVVFTIISVMDN